MDLAAEVVQAEDSDCTDCFGSFGDRPSKTIKIARKFGSRRHN